VIYLIIAVPADTPVTTPEASTEAMAGLTLLHVPPGTALLNAVVAPRQTPAIPVIGNNGFTVIVAMAVHPSDVVYVIIEVPADTPSALAVTRLIATTPVVPLLHVPPRTVLCSTVVAPWHIENVPVMGAIGFTETLAEDTQPAGVV
jgi:hypothetical protein